jgi:hypothetical protein
VHLSVPFRPEARRGAGAVARLLGYRAGRWAASVRERGAALLRARGGGDDARGAAGASRRRRLRAAVYAGLRGIEEGQAVASSTPNTITQMIIH